MSRRASFQFYPLDWIGNPNLKRCTRAERSMWIDIMCLMSQEERFGVLAWPLEEIAQAIGEPVKALMGLVRKGVMKGSDERCEAFVYTPRSGRKDGKPVTLIEEQDGPLWFSSRMVTDDYKAGNSGGKTRFKSSPSDAPSRRQGEGEGAGQDEHPDQHLSRAPPSSSSSSSATQKEKPLVFSKKDGVGDEADQTGRGSGSGPSPEFLERLKRRA